MGCCLSTKNDNKTTPKSQNYPVPPPEPPATTTTAATIATTNRSPPPVEEETVKEILMLSETPVNIITKQQPEPDSEPPITDHRQEKTKIKEDEKTPEASMVSEVCSITESFSTSTTTACATAVTGEDEAISKPSRVGRSPAKAPPRKRMQTGREVARGTRERVSRSPAGRKEAVPMGPRIVRGRESGHLGPKNHNASPRGVRRDSGDGSGHRSRSPAFGRTGGVRRATVKMSPVKTMTAANSRSTGVGSVAGTCTGTDVGSGPGVDEIRSVSGPNEVKETESNDVVSEQGTESIENPLVSMECFIFI